MTDSKLPLNLHIHEEMWRSQDRVSHFPEVEALRIRQGQAREGSGILIFRGSGHGWNGPNSALKVLADPSNLTDKPVSLINARNPGVALDRLFRFELGLELKTAILINAHNPEVAPDRFLQLGLGLDADLHLGLDLGLVDESVKGNIHHIHHIHHIRHTRPSREREVQHTVSMMLTVLVRQITIEDAIQAQAAAALFRDGMDRMACTGTPCQTGQGRGLEEGGGREIRR